MKNMAYIWDLVTWSFLKTSDENVLNRANLTQSV